MMKKKLTNKNKAYLMIGAILIAGAFMVYFMRSFAEKATTTISLQPDDATIVALGKDIYVKNCASCHGLALEGQANWRQRDADGYLPPPPHDATGHTWHHSDDYLFSMTKYGIEKMIGQTYPNNMPAYEQNLSDEQIIEVLSYIKSTWPKHIRDQHDRINMRVNARKE